MKSRTKPVLRLLAVTGLAGAVVVGMTSNSANAADNILKSDKAVARSCFASPLAAGTSGADRREVTSTVDGVIQARLSPDGTEGDWDLAVFDKATGAVVSASATLRSRELAEGFVKKGQELVVQGCRYGGTAKSVTLGIDFLALAKDGTPTPAVSTQVQPETAQLVRVHTADRKAKNKLTSLGLDVTEKADATTVDVIISGEQDKRVLTGAGFSYDVLDADLSATSRRNAEKDRQFSATTQSTGVPSGRTSYRHLWDYEYEMKELARNNPNLVKAFTLNHPSIEGRDVTGVEITPDVRNGADGKAVNMIMALHHAREWPAAEHAAEWAYELVKGYKSGDSTIKPLVGKTRNVIVPVVNPDGFNVSREAEPKGDFSRFDYEMKRKTCRVEDSPPQYRTGICMANPAGRVRGTDPNRNYAGFWGGAGASFNWSSDTFRGGAPFSEPETQNVQEFIAGRQVTNMLTLHTYSNLVLRVPGVADARFPLDEPAYKALGAQMASRNGYTNEPGFSLYDTTGTTEDWSYWATGGWGFTMEIGPNEFHPPYAEGVAAEYLGLAPAAGAGKGGNRQAFLDMLTNAATPSTHSTLVGSAPRDYKLQLRKSFQTPTSPIRQPDGTTKPPIYWTDTLKSDFKANGGRFAWEVNPSTRPYIAGRFGRDPVAPHGATIPLANPDGVPAENVNFPSDPTAERIPFHVNGLPQEDNGKFFVKVDWTNPDTDWDLYVFDSAGNVVASSAQGGTTEEHAVLYDPPAGDYVAVMVNYDQIDGQPVDDWRNLRVEFESPLPAVYGPKEPYQLTCSNPAGKLVGLADVYLDRGQTVDVGEVCTSGATRERKLAARSGR